MCMLWLTRISELHESRFRHKALAERLQLTFAVYLFRIRTGLYGVLLQ